MTALSMVRVRSFVLAAFILVGSLLLAPAARADQQGGTIGVSAAVVSTLSMTITDRTMNFGQNLSSFAPTSDSTDNVYNTAAGPYVWYRWRPSPTGQPPTLASVTSSTPWTLTLSMVENGGSSPDLRLDQDDFRKANGPGCDQPVTAADVDTYLAINAGHAYPVNQSAGGGGSSADACFFLRVAAGDTPGSFVSTITLTVSN